MDIEDRELEFSPLGGRVTRDGLTVEVYIYRFEGTDEEWTLEVVDHMGATTVWKGLFPDDSDAYAAFERTVAEDGIASFSDTEIVRH